MVGSVRRYGGCDSGGGVMGEAPDGTSIYLGTLRVEINQKLGSKLFKNVFILGVALRARNHSKSFQNLLRCALKSGACT